jgi:hypothetical protein
MLILHQYLRLLKQIELSLKGVQNKKVMPIKQIVARHLVCCDQNVSHYHKTFSTRNFQFAGQYQCTQENIFFACSRCP